MKRFIAYTLVALLIIGILPVEIYADTALSEECETNPYS